MYLIFDTETTGKWIKDKPIHDNNQPRIIEIAAILADEQLEVKSSINSLIRPNGFKIPSSATKIHGITNEHAEEHGISIRDALEQFKILANIANDTKEGMLIAHNFEFDFNLLLREYYLIAGSDCKYLSLLQPFCTMKVSTDICQIPSIYKKGSFKWPTLVEAYKHFHGEDNLLKFGNMHRALNDTLMCLDIFRALRKLENDG